MPRITKIDATINPLTHLPQIGIAKRKTAAYARVSTDSDEQFTSYEAQVDYYTKMINNNPQWDFVKVYTDEGISGLSTKKRDGFNEMIKDALSGKIDLIITKSVSRFARNTVDSLVTIRKLKDKGCECYFEKENIFTFDGKGELLISIMSSLAQEESRSISENVTWGKRKQFADGKISLPYSSFLGYDKGEDGKPIVNESEAETVREIYRQFMLGKSVTAICRNLTKNGLKTPGGKDKWRESTVYSILRNEKYKGDALLQKKFTVDFLQKKMKKNEGEVPQYYVEGSHEAIISPAEFKLVQAEMKRRSDMGKRFSGKSIFASKIVCGDCGGYYGSKVWHSTDKYRRTVLHCNNKFNGTKCSTPTLDENTVKEAFIKAYNIVSGSKDEILLNCETLLQSLEDTSGIDKKIGKIDAELKSIADLISDLISKNSTQALSQTDYNEKYTELTKKYEKKLKAKTKLLSQKQDLEYRITEIKAYVEKLKSSESVISEWDDMLWMLLIEKATVYHNGKISFLFKDGTEVNV